MASAPEQVGYYSAASRLVIAIRALSNPINNAIFPHIANLAAKSRKDALVFFRKRVLLLNVPFLLMALGMFVVAPLAVRLIYGPRYVETGVLLRIMAPLPFLHSMEMCFGNYYMLAFGYEKEWSKVVRRMMLLNFILIFPMMKLVRPARGIAATMILAESFALGSYMLFYRKTASATEQKAVALTPGQV